MFKISGIVQNVNNIVKPRNKCLYGGYHIQLLYSWSDFHSETLYGGI